MTNNIQPLHDYIFLSPVEAQNTSPILVSKPSYHQGRVVAVGPGRERPLTISPGQIVIYKPERGLAVDQGFLVDAQDVLAVVG